MNQSRQKILIGYVAALIIFLIALMLRAWIAPGGPGLPFLTFYPAMVLTFYLCGIGPGIVVTVLCSAFGYYRLTQSGDHFSGAYSPLPSTIFFLISAGMVGAMIRTMRSSFAALKLSEQRYERMLEDQTELICRFLPDDTLLYVNDAYCRFFGKSRSELLGHQWQHLVMPGRGTQFREQLHRLTPANPVMTIENPVVDSNGAIRWCQFANRAFFDQAGMLSEIQSVGRDISRQRELEQALSANEHDFRLLAESMPQIVWITRPCGENIYFNQHWVEYTGLTLEQSYGSGWLEAVHPDDRQRAWDAWHNAENTGGTYSLECQLRRFDGAYRWWLLRGVPIFDISGSINKWFGTFTDIQRFKETENELSIAATAFNANVGIIVTDENSIILRVNKAFTEQTGYAPGEIVGKSPHLLRSGRHEAAFYDAIREGIRLNGSWQGEVWERRKNGEVYPKLLTISAVKGSNGEVKRYVSTQFDMTDQKTAEEKIRKLAFFDPLTKLPNRRLLMDRLHQALSSSTRTGKGVALMFIDLDDFKTLNDTLGHGTGDMLLQQVAIRLQSSVREADTVARLGGDEFVIMLEELGSGETEAALQTEETSNKIIARLNEPYQLEGNTCHSTASIGCTVFFDHRYPVNELLKQADIAMYQAKKDGRNNMRFFDERMQTRINSRVALEKELRTALQLGQFKMHYQLQRDESGLTLGAEALIRWMHPERGLVYPMHFIPQSEESDLILDIGMWALDTACAQIGKWQKNAHTCKLILAVNISPRQFRQGDFTEQLRTIMQRHAINPSLLKLELTESLLLEKVELTVSTMNSLRKNGVQFSLDDFGTGYSSLQYLKKMPFDQLKIAEPFVRDIDLDDNDRALVRTIISMGHSLNLDVIAEGVETEEQHQFLLNNGCEHFQGYLFGAPLPIQEFEVLLESFR